jgi:DNA-binding transcriptional LysR family regulator
LFVRQLSYLIALDRHCHFARAAESCNVSQPALSAGIIDLERELGITIIKRNRRFQGITPEGKRVLAWARQVLASLEGLRQEAELMRSVPGGHLAIGTISSALQATSLLTAEYRKVIPELTLEVYALSAKDILEGLKCDDLQLGVTYSRTAIPEDHDVLPLFTERYVLVAGQKADLPSSLTWAEVGRLPLCLLNQEMLNHEIIQDAFNAAEVTPKIVMETNTIALMYSQVQCGRVFGILPVSELLPANVIDIRIRTQTIRPEYSSNVGLFRLRRCNQPPLCEMLWKIAARVKLQAELEPVQGMIPR